VLSVEVITRIEGVDFGELFFTCLEELLLKLGIVPLDCILICDYKKRQVVKTIRTIFKREIKGGRNDRVMAGEGAVEK